MDQAPKKIPRGVRNNNPLNIDKSKDKWQGLAEAQPDKRFATFKDPTYGIRAGARILIKYQDDYKKDTITKIINRWAPPVENDTPAYIDRVSEATGFGPKQVLDMHKFEHLFPLIKAMIVVECGYQPYTDAQITKGCVLAGVEPTKTKEKSIVTTNTVKVASAGAAVTVASPIMTTLEKVEEHSYLFERILDYGPYVMAAIGVALFGYFIYTRWDDRRKGIR